MKKYITILCLALLAVSTLVLGGCGGSDNNSKKVAVAFANSSSSWQTNGQTIKEKLEKEGYTVDLQFADTPEQQIEQIKKQLADSPKCLVIGAVDSTALKDVLTEAKEKKVAVIAYDRLIMNTDAVSYYASFDNLAVGQAMGEYIEAKLQLKTGAGPFNMEVFAGDPADNNAHVFYDGAMEVLKPYIDKGQLVIPSKETSFEQVAVKGWKAEGATERMTKLLQGPDAGVKLDVILSPNDGLAGGIREALSKGGYSEMPLLTGQDAESQALDAIRNGKQTITIYKSPALLVAKTVRMIKAVVEGTQPDINDVKSYNNGVIVVPAYLCTPLIIDKDNLSEVK